jgi:nicotinate-nucleotide adenylyltransferase
LAVMSVGVFGGTFNPIHLGHLHIACSVQQLFGLSRIYLVVASTPPHKPGLDLAPFLDRYAMVSVALSGSDRLIPSAIELERPASPFSIDTMKKFARRSKSGHDGLCFIAGGDSLYDVVGWHRGEELLASYNFVFAMRPGVDVNDPRSVVPGRIADRVRDLRGYGARSIRREAAATAKRGRAIFVVDVSAPDISASQVRSLVSDGRSVKRFVPGPVIRYIKKLGLYGER